MLSLFEIKSGDKDCSQNSLTTLINDAIETQLLSGRGHSNTQVQMVGHAVAVFGKL